MWRRSRSCSWCSRRPSPAAARTAPRRRAAGGADAVGAAGRCDDARGRRAGQRQRDAGERAGARARRARDRRRRAVLGERSTCARARTSSTSAPSAPGRRATWRALRVTRRSTIRVPDAARRARGRRASATLADLGFDVARDQRRRPARRVPRRPARSSAATDPGRRHAARGRQRGRDRRLEDLLSAERCACERQSGWVAMRAMRGRPPSRTTPNATRPAMSSRPERRTV